MGGLSIIGGISKEKSPRNFGLVIISKPVFQWSTYCLNFIVLGGNQYPYRHFFLIPMPDLA
jgi:hypothetical protein